jgi:hypothetical protein
MHRQSCARGALRVCAAFLCAATWATPAPAQIVFNATTFPGVGTAISVGDVNEDGSPDVLVSDRASLQVRLYLNDGQGGLVLPPLIPSLNYEPHDSRLLDINGDGHLDIVVVTGISVQYQLGAGDGTFGPLDGTNVEGDVIVPTLDCHPSQRAILVVSQKPFRCVPWTGSFLGSPIISSAPEGTVDAVDAGDVDGDGLTDVATLRANAIVQVWRNAGDGTFTLLPGGYSTQTSRSIAVGDLNGDDLLDIASGGIDGVFVKYNTGGGTFNGSEVLFPSGGRIRSLAIQDMNGDDANDVVVGLEDIGSINLLLNDGVGQLALDSATLITPIRNVVAVGLFNDDGLPDIAGAGDVGISVLLQQPAGEPPQANAGADQSIVAKPNESVQVTLDGSASTGTDLVYAWFDVTSGTPIAIGGTAQITVAVSSLGDHRFRLVVTNELGESSDETVVRLTLPNGHVPPGQTH